MIVPLNWLKDYVDFNIPPEELGEMLTMAGLELEAMEYRGIGLENLVVAQITELRAHPNADRLSICVVTDGSRDYSIVCGADNMKKGDKVALATVGAKLPPSLKFPDGLEIKKAKIRGERSEGMLCAENELGLTDNSEGIMILPKSARVGTRVIDALNIEDIIFELGITPNRPDCLSMIGVAREVSAITGVGLKYPSSLIDESAENTEDLAKVEVQDADACPRYTCRVIRNIETGASPEWIRNRLESAGIRSINNVVDITNFVLLETGQPLHAFDLNLLCGKKIVVRKAKKSERLRTLDGIERELTPDDLLICDAKKPVALAGIMGGEDTEVSDNTTDILLESALFNPVVVRRTSKRTALRTDSSYRFERGVDPEGVVKALDRAASLIQQICKGQVSRGRIDVSDTEFKRSEITVSAKKVNKILGIDITTYEISDILRSLEFEVTSADEEYISVIPPTFRVDIYRPIDIIEEVGRLFGYNNIQQTEPLVKMSSEQVETRRSVDRRLKDVFFSNGFLEAINYTFEDPSRLALFYDNPTMNILNPITTEGSCMRTSLLPGLVKNLKLNSDRGESDIKLYESGKVFYMKKKGQLPREVTKFAAVATGRRQPDVWGRENYDFFDIKGVLMRGLSSLSLGSEIEFERNPAAGFLHPGVSARILVGGSECGIVGELHPDYYEKFDLDRKVYLAELDMDMILKLHESVSARFSPLPRYPGVRRDVSVIVSDTIAAGDIVREIKSVSNLIEDVWVFDVFQDSSLGEGKKSVAISMLLRSEDKTLTDTDANKVQSDVLERVNSSLGAELRQN